MAKSRAITLTAVNGKEVSGPFRVYLRDGYEEPSKNVVLRIENAVDRNGNEVLQLSNGDAGIIVSHNPEYIEGVLTGFRAKIDDDIFVTVKPFKDNIAPESKVAKAEKF